MTGTGKSLQPLFKEVEPDQNSMITYNVDLSNINMHVMQVK